MHVHASETCPYCRIEELERELSDLSKAYGLQRAELAACEKARNDFRDSYLRKQAVRVKHGALAAEQAYSVKLREALDVIAKDEEPLPLRENEAIDECIVRLAQEALSIPHDTTAINQHVAGVLMDIANALEGLKAHPGNEWGEGYMRGVADVVSGMRRKAEELTNET